MTATEEFREQLLEGKAYGVVMSDMGGAWECLLPSLVGPSKSAIVRRWNKHMRPYCGKSWETARRKGLARIVRVKVTLADA